MVTSVPLFLYIFKIEEPEVRYEHSGSNKKKRRVRCRNIGRRRGSTDGAPEVQGSSLNFYRRIFYDELVGSVRFFRFIDVV